MKVRINYPALTASTGHEIYEHVEAVNVGGQRSFDGGTGWGQLRAHAIFMPLAPGDVVAYDLDTELAFDLGTLESLYTYDVDFMLPGNLITGQALAADDPAQRIINETIETWRREAWATQHTGLSAYVSAGDQKWLEDRVVLCEYVDHVQLVRWPGMEIDFDVARANADLGDLTKGPWA